MGLSPFQERLAVMIASLPAADGFALAGGSGLAAHGLLERRTRDLDYFGRPVDADRVQALAAAIATTCDDLGLTVTRERDGGTFVRLVVAGAEEACEVDVAVDYRHLDVVATPYGPALDVEELAANKVLAIFDRAAPRDYVDLASLVHRVPVREAIELAQQKDPGLDLQVLDAALERVTRIRAQDLGLSEGAREELLDEVGRWRGIVTQLQRPGPEFGL
ncbi:hypothetical protein DVS28_a1461 [Euzebya pacifica]|uniref:Nucleotidyl transferase AbiEii toxin, Type IV TA system n=1 Tax=Euzebya pacifica TaxID=1608957 RepID=A0A346XVB3_9ACTN|nr:nucleotidyl transferase AbiEii/AbiGii toxin family protein [Euzebya pacifica]AXV06160.1 hypothetical protein DVS28_a1461 [Euzebya pacifica]